MKKLLFLIPFLCGQLFAATQTLKINQFGGTQDLISPDKLADKYSPDCQNVVLDEYRGSIINRRGDTAYNTTALDGGQAVKSQFVYKQQAGDEYIIVNSSNSIFYSKNGSGSFSIITSTVTAGKYSFATGKDLLFGQNGTDNMLSWNGPALVHYTVANSTNVPKGTIIRYWRNRLFVAGVPGAESTIYYSEYNDPANFGTFNYINLNVADGDYITGMMPWEDKMVATKRYSTSVLQETASGVFDFGMISKEVGCLYGESMTEVKGFPMWVSHRGVELYDGQFNLVSEIIDNQIKGLKQLNVGGGAWELTTAEDWGAGSGTNIDTTTYSGSVAIGNEAITQYAFSESGTVYTEVDYTSAIRQKFVTKKTLSIDRIRASLSTANGECYVGIYDANMTHISTSTIFTGDADVAIPHATLLANSTYYLCAYFTEYSPFSVKTSAINSISTNTLITADIEHTRGGIWMAFIPGDALGFALGLETGVASYTSDTKEAINWGSWGQFSVTDSQPPGSTITYYVRTSTASDNMTSRPLIPAVNGGAINSTVGPYILTVSSYTSTSSTTTPCVNSINVYWNSTSGVPMVAQSYKDRYYLGVMSANADHNDTVYVFDRDANLIKYTGINMGASCIYKNRWYTGNSNGDGKLYLQDVPNLFSNHGTVYQSYWTSKVFDGGSVMVEKMLSDLWVAARNTPISSLLYLDYRMDGTDSAWLPKTLDMSQTYGYKVKRIPLPLATKGYYFQFRIRSETANNFEFKELNCNYDYLPMR